MLILKYQQPLVVVGDLLHKNLLSVVTNWLLVNCDIFDCGHLSHTCDHTSVKSRGVSVVVVFFYCAFLVHDNATATASMLKTDAADNDDVAADDDNNIFVVTMLLLMMMVLVVMKGERTAETHLATLVRAF